MRDISNSNFGLLISYVVPGFTALWGISYFSPTLATWLNGTNGDGPTVGGFLYVTIASIAAGMTCSAIRFQTIDRIHAMTGIPCPTLDFATLANRTTAYDRLISNHYNYYKFHANELITLVIVYIARQVTVRDWAGGGEDFAFIVIGVLFFATSRDNLQKYHSRAAKLLGTREDIKQPKQHRRRSNRSPHSILKKVLNRIR
ncbi:MAG: hypothetical protein H6822_31200 [Planctomycetaceae bacterium]|nr:hypothetical protein [Planctomycetales bacterium]MCB9926648.1 hypothetical protein [Planctomycetaceae bacterium]